MNPDGSDLTQLTNGRHIDSNPSWSPDGSRIVFSCFDSPANLFLINADGTGSSKLAHATGRDWQMYPEWSPNGHTIAFEQGDHTLSRIRPSSGRIHVLFRCSCLGFHNAPAWSPDGTHIAIGLGQGRPRKGSRALQARRKRLDQASHEQDAVLLPRWQPLP